MNTEAIKKKIRAQLEIEHQAKERIFSLADTAKELAREIRNSDDALDRAFLGKSMENDAEEKLNSLIAEHKELTTTLNKTQRELAYLRDLLQFS